MSKELEALDIIDDDIKECFAQTNKFDEKIELVELIRKALTPPTEQEVCDKLSEYYKFNIKYDEQSREFRFEDNSNITKYGIFGYQVVVYIPPHLITLIGRFYEEKEREGK